MKYEFYEENYNNNSNSSNDNLVISTTTSNGRSSMSPTNFTSPDPNLSNLPNDLTIKRDRDSPFNNTSESQIHLIQPKIERCSPIPIMRSSQNIRDTSPMEINSPPLIERSSSHDVHSPRLIMSPPMRASQIISPPMRNNSHAQLSISHNHQQPSSIKVSRTYSPPVQQHHSEHLSRSSSMHSNRLSPMHSEYFNSPIFEHNNLTIKPVPLINNSSMSPPIVVSTSNSGSSSGIVDFRIPSTPTSVVSSSTCSPPIMMRPPPPPPPLKHRNNENKHHHQQQHQQHQQQQQQQNHHSGNQNQLEEPTSSIPDLEFDGTTVLCRVCGDKASGFHYGVHSCEGCKGFFRRSIQQKIQYRPCTKNQQCSILRINRNRCQYCRLKKCIAVGMSRDAVRFGRVPKREKARILAAMQQSTNTKCQEKAVAAELEDDQKLLMTVIRAHLDTCDFTHEKVQPMLRQAREKPRYTACPSTLACPLNPNPNPLSGQQELLQDFSKRFSPAIRGVVEFAKRIPGFGLLSQDDQVTLLKAGVFEVLLVRLACMFDNESNTMVCLNGEVLVRDSIHSSSNARFLMDSMFDFADRLNVLNLTDAEIGLFSSIVVISPDRPGLRNIELVEKMHNKLKNILVHVLNQNHYNNINITNELLSKIPDLRTLNTLHSEKLLAFKMTEQQQLAQQQQQNNSYLDDINSKSPSDGSTTWSDVTMDEVKSPLGSVSSTESVCGNEIANINDYTNNYNNQNNNNSNSIHVQNAPLLAATLAGNIQCPFRNRTNSNSTNESDKVHFNTTPNMNRMNHSNNNNRLDRKLDSPTDSGIESGTELRHIEIKSVTSAPTSVCSSPRSSFEDKDCHFSSNNNNNTSNNNNIEDMPVLKRILQAPPLDTNSLMSEAYKPHKKFRALRQKDIAEAEPLTNNNTHNQTNNNCSSPPQQTSNTNNHQFLLQSLQQTPNNNLASSHSMLAKSLMEGPRNMTPDQIKRTEIVHNYIMRTSSPPLNNNSYFNRNNNWNNSVIKTPPTSTITSNALLELQVAATSQPLNLSKKTPPSSPRMSVVSLEA